MPRAKTAAASPKVIPCYSGVRPVESPEAVASRAKGSPHRYFHKTMVWLGSDLTNVERDALTAHAQRFRVYRHGQWYYNENGEPAYQLNNPSFTHCVEIIAGNSAAFACLGKRNIASVTINEFASDWVFANEADAAQMHRAFNQALVQHYNYDNERMEFANGGTSTGRRSGMYHTWYHNQPSRLTGESNCFHYEVRVNNGTKMRNVGILHAKDLANFDFESFFAKYSTLYSIDFERLGRYHRNKYAKTKSRAQIPVGLDSKNNTKGKHAHYYNTQSKDWHTGRVLWRMYAINNYGTASVQQFLQQYVNAHGRGRYVQRIGMGKVSYVSPNESNLGIDI